MAVKQNKIKHVCLTGANRKHLFAKSKRAFLRTGSVFCASAAPSFPLYPQGLCVLWWCCVVWSLMGASTVCSSTPRVGGAWGRLWVSPPAEAGLFLPGLEQWGFSAEVLGSCCCGLQSMSAESLPGGRGTSSGLSVPRRVVFAIPVASGLSDGGSRDAARCRAGLLVRISKATIAKGLG